VLALYEGKVTATIEPAGDGTLPKALALTVQACSNQICLEPETVRVPVVLN